MTSKLLDFVRPGRKSNVAIHAEALAATETAAQVPLPVDEATLPAHGVQGPLDYPSIKNWLRDCEDHLERGRDGHAYTSMTLIFAMNGCTRIDDITRMSPADMKVLAVDGDLDVTVGLINRVHKYAIEDVARVRFGGRLAM